MRDQATLTVYLRDEHDQEVVGSSRLIAGPFLECFEPVDVCDRGETAVILRLAGNKNAHTEATVQVVRKRREKYAKILAEEIAKEIVEFMESKDTRNGYKP